MRRTAMLAAALALGAGAAAAGTQLSGSLAGELRYFTQAPAFAAQSTARLQWSSRIEARGVYDWNGGADRIVVAPFLRFGDAAAGRNHLDLREGFWLHQGAGWSLTVGVDKVFWGVTESRHLVDIVNQTDGLEDIDGEDKLGQPMVALSFTGDYGTLSLYALPWFRERGFAPVTARLGGPAPILGATYDPGAGPGRIDFAARWSRAFGDWDVALSYFNGKDREPRMIATAAGLVPHYDLIGQAGLEVQYTTGDWLWKLEALHRTGQGPGFWAATGGFEWTLYGIGGSAADLGLIAEYSHDGRNPALAPATIYDNDLFLGARLGLNDTGDASLLGGVLIDAGSDARVYLIEAQRRLGDDWRLSLEGRFLAGTSATDPAAAIRTDDYLSLSLERFF